MDVTCCGNPVSITIGITQSIIGLQVIPQTALKICPLKNVKMSAMDAFIVAPVQDAALEIGMIAGIANTSQLLVIAEVNIIMPKFETNEGPILVACKTPTTITASIFIMANRIGDETATFSSIFPKQGMVRIPPQASSPPV